MASRAFRGLLLPALICLCEVPCLAASVQEIRNSAPSNWGPNVSGPLCGIYAACNALHLIGVDVQPSDLVKSDYVGTCGGSTAREIAHAIEDCGASACTMSNLSSWDLRLAGAPIIANVRLNPAMNRFNHWVVVVPCRDGVTIYDGIEKPYNTTIAEFLGNWSGVGISVTQKNDFPYATIWLGRSVILLSLALVCFMLFRFTPSKQFISSANPALQLFGIVTTTLLLTVVGNAVFGDLPHCQLGLATSTAHTRAGKYRSGTLDDAEKAGNSYDMLLVDARLQQDYRHGTIKGAINIPVTANYSAVRRRLDSLDRKTPIVVFCQSATCPFSATVANELSALQFIDVTVCDKGWSEYKRERIASK